MKNIFAPILLSFLIFHAHAQPGAGILSKQETDSLILQYCEVLNETYFNQEKSRELTQTLRKKLKAGEFYNVTQLTDRISLLMRDMTHDIHFYLGVNPTVDTIIVEQETDAPAENKNGGFSQVRILDGNIGYIRWDAFIVDEVSFKKAIAVLQFVEGCTSLIFDLSQCPGGDGRIGSFMNRHLFESDGYQNLLQKRCTGEKSWSVSEVPYNYTNGPALYDLPVYVIVSEHTASASEYFALIMQEMKRGVVLGNTTAGAGNPSTIVTFGNYFAYIPICEIETTNGTSIEGKGVKPDVFLTSEDWIEETVEYIRSHTQK